MKFASLILYCISFSFFLYSQDQLQTIQSVSIIAESSQLHEGVTADAYIKTADGWCAADQLQVNDIVFPNNKIIAIKKTIFPSYHQLILENKILKCGSDTKILIPHYKIYIPIKKLEPLLHAKKIYEPIELFQITTQKGILYLQNHNLIIHNADLALLSFELSYSFHPILTLVGAATYFTTLYVQAQNTSGLANSNTDLILERLYSIYQYKRTILESLKTEYENLHTIFSTLIYQSYELQETIKLICPKKNIILYPMLSYQAWENAFNNDDVTKQQFLHQVELDIKTLEDSVLFLHENILSSIHQAITQRNNIFKELQEYIHHEYNVTMHVNYNDPETVIQAYKIVIYLDILLYELHTKQNIVELFVQEIERIQHTYTFFSLIPTQNIKSIETQNEQTIKICIEQTDLTNEKNKIFLEDIIQKYNISLTADFKLSLYNERAESQQKRISQAKNVKITYNEPGGPEKDPDDENEKEKTETLRVPPKNHPNRNHILNSNPGHLSDTPENVSLIEKIANDPSAFINKDQYGNIWHAKTLQNGTQAWVRINNNQIKSAGVNNIPRTYDALTGFCNNLNKSNKS